MYGVIVLASLLTLVSCTGEGNIHLLEHEIVDAIRSCSDHTSRARNRRSENNEKYPRIDVNGIQERNQDHESNTSKRNQMHVLNYTDYDYMGYGSGDVGEKFIKTIPRPALNNNSNSIYNGTRLYRKKRSDLLGKDDSDQCLSQCVFANLQIVDSNGIPQEAKFWNKIQTSVNSQQSRALLKDQLRSCFEELETESEDNGCSYSNRLERCLMLRLPDRQMNASKKKQSNVYNSYKTIY